MSNLGWTDERKALLKQLWLVEGLSASQCAKRLGGGLSRSAVIGKADREGYKRGVAAGLANNAKAARERAPRPKLTARRVDTLTGKVYPVAPLQAMPMAATDVLSPNAKPWIQREPNECAYPVSGQGADTVSCCNPADGPYCAGHRRICFQPKSAVTASQAKERERHLVYVATNSTGRPFEEWAAA